MPMVRSKNAMPAATVTYRQRIQNSINRAYGFWIIQLMTRAMNFSFLWGD